MVREYIQKKIEEIKKTGIVRFIVEQLLDLLLVTTFVLHFLMNYIPFRYFLGVLILYIFYHAYKHVKKIYGMIKERKRH